MSAAPIRSRPAGFVQLKLLEACAIALGWLAIAEGDAMAAPSSTKEAAAACTMSAEKAQLLRRQGKLMAARTELVACGADACPTVIRDDCRTWTAEVHAAQPTVVFSVRGSNGADLVDARVAVDGQTFVERIDGLARPIDPGPHEIEVRAASEMPVRLRIVVHEGEKQRVIPVVFTAPSTSAVRAAPITPWVYVTGALAVTGIAGFAFFGVTALSDHASMRDGCATTHSCTEDQIESNRARFWIADASLLVGAVAAGITGYLLYDHSRARRSSRALAAKHAVDLRVSGHYAAGPFVAVQTLF